MAGSHYREGKPEEDVARLAEELDVSLIVAGGREAGRFGSLFDPRCSGAVYRRAVGREVDVRDPAGCEALVAVAHEAFGRLDVLITSAGIAHSRSFLQTSLELRHETLAVNLTGTFLCCQAAAPAMVEAGGGRIITIASVSGQRGGTGRAAYGASKGGVITLTRVMAVELARYNITVNAIAPGPVETRLSAQRPARKRRTEGVRRIR